MPPIEISAVLSDGMAVLFLAPANAPNPGSALVLPRCVLGDDDPSIEDALAAYLLDGLGVTVLEQEFIETVYEPQPGGGVILNNLQIISTWDGVPVAGGGLIPVWVPVDAVPQLDLDPGIRSPLLGALGIASASLGGTASPTATGRIIVITGPAGAGKTTVSRSVAGLLERCAVVSLDDLWHLVLSGVPVPAWRGGDPEETRGHLLLCLQNAAALARNFALAGYDCIVEGVLERPQDLDELLGGLMGFAVSFFMLTPEADALASRDHRRPPGQQMGGRSQELHDIVRTNGEFRGSRIDTTGMDVQETAELIALSLDEARVL